MKLYLNKEEFVVEAFSMSQTYGGLLAGRIDKDFNLELIKNLDTPKGWGKGRKLSLLMPNETELSTCLPVFTCFAWFTKHNNYLDSGTPDGTQVFIAFFDDGKGDLENKFRNILAKLNWNECSEDFWF